MKDTIKRVLVLLMCIPFLPIFYIGTSAATVNYVKDGQYVYNWGEREVDATFLSPMAEDFYEKYGVSYESLSALSGGTGVSDAPASALYAKLKALMKTAHKHETGYQETRYLYKYTDCEGGGGRISSFYSGDPIGPEWDSGTTWNREHTWPNSKGLAGNDENDIMMLRPTATSENGARSNKAYGESAGYYDPNSESGGAHDVRGDVSRIFLYIYVRWGNVNGNGSYDTWGTRGVIESLEVLLAWMEADPVDTWELGRNDAVEAITGTRNVFVDYPELAFLLFGAEIPDDMVTPSGEAMTPPCNHIYQNACDVDCDLCSEVREVGDHVYANKCDTDCDNCGEVRTVGNHVYNYYCSAACKECGAPREAAHLYVGWQEIEPATPEKPGTERGTCVYCHEPAERDIPYQAPPENPNPPAGETPTPPPAGSEESATAICVLGIVVGAVVAHALSVQ